MVISFDWGHNDTVMLRVWSLDNLIIRVAFCPRTCLRKWISKYVREVAAAANKMNLNRTDYIIDICVSYFYKCISYENRVPKTIWYHFLEKLPTHTHTMRQLFPNRATSNCNDQWYFTSFFVQAVSTHWPHQLLNGSRMSSFGRIDDRLANLVQPIRALVLFFTHTLHNANLAYVSIKWSLKLHATRSDTLENAWHPNLRFRVYVSLSPTHPPCAHSPHFNVFFLTQRFSF